MRLRIFETLQEIYSYTVFGFFKKLLQANILQNEAVSWFLYVSINSLDSND